MARSERLPSYMPDPDIPLEQPQLPAIIAQQAEEQAVQEELCDDPTIARFTNGFGSSSNN
jgi:hypothetical protein